MRRALALALAASVAGCASIEKERGHDVLAREVQDRTGASSLWAHGTPEEAQISGWVEQRLRGGLTQRAAVEIALVNNPSLQSTYEQIGIAQADLLQAGLLPNPTLSGSVGFPLNGALIEGEGAIIQDFLSILLLPLKKQVAEKQFVAAVKQVTHDALRAVAEASTAFVDVQAEEQRLAFRKVVVSTAEAAADLAQHQFDAGNITELALANERATAEQARLDLAREELALFDKRARLNRLLGLWGQRAEWALAEPLAPLPREELPLEHIEARAVSQRLDVASLRERAELMDQAVDLTRKTWIFGRFELGVHGHRDADGPQLLGPNLVLELPIFDQRQAVIARVEAERRQAYAELNATALDARTEARSAAMHLLAARQVAEHYQKTLLPLRDQVLAQSQLQYNAMQIGGYQLLAAKQTQVEAQLAYLDAVQTYWQARIELARAVGGRLEPKPEPTPEPTPQPATATPNPAPPTSTSGTSR